MDNVRSENISLFAGSEPTGTAISYTIPGFEGPLDLLLHLVQKHKLDILDIPIAALLKQYIDTIEEWKNADLDIATEFLEMAARLVHIKSCMLLPRHEEGDELRSRLSGELMEYRLCRETARRLAVIHIGNDIYIRQPAEIEPDNTYRLVHSPVTMFDAYFAAAGRGRRRLPPPMQAFTGIVSRKIVSVSSKIVFVLRRLYRGQSVRYTSLFESAQSKSELVATFLALLELVKASRIRVDGHGANQQVTMADGKDNS